ncbi:MAG: hypothetical protein IH621_07030 [Krumholzibacteria bacterium]|nr:hypothetical protein [Candidatus Krumholzibacteria bacterium]
MIPAVAACARLLLVLPILVAGSALGFPGTINYQGILTDTEGTPLEGAHALQFAIYPDSTGGGPLWSELHPGVDVADGLFQVLLGRIQAFPEGLFDSDDLWLGMAVDQDPEMQPRMRVTSTPYAFRSEVADSAAGGTGGASDGDWCVLGNDMYAGVSGNIGIGTAAPAAKLDIVGGALGLRRAGSPEQWLEVRDTNADGAIVASHSLESNKKPLRLQALHDGSGAPSGHTSIVFYVGEAAAPTTAMIIGETAEIGIGTVSPARRLEVRDPTRAYLRLTSDTAYQPSTLELKGRAWGSSVLKLGAINFLDEADGVRSSLSYMYSGVPTASWQMVLDPGSGSAVYFHESGNVGIGVSAPSRKLEVDGTTRCHALEITGGADLAEPFDVSGGSDIGPGMVVAIDPDLPGRLKLAGHPYDRCVAGIVSGAGGIAAGMVMGHEGTAADGSHPVALTGRVYCYATADGGPIVPGDLLTTSTVPGHAMKVQDHGRAQGAVIGKAMSRLPEGRGLVLVLVSLQ